MLKKNTFKHIIKIFVLDVDINVMQESYESYEREICKI